jgi:hypothetical protein
VDKTKFNTLIKKLPNYALWVMLFLFYFAIGAQFNFVRGTYQALLLTFLQLTAYYVNLKCFMPKYYGSSKRRYNIFSLLFVLGLALFGVAMEIIYVKLLPEYAPPKLHLAGAFAFSLIFVLVAFWGGITKFLIGRQEKTNTELEALRRENAESELKFLKTQINPHFLFNALNNIYSMAYTGDKSTPEKITMLSDMLRYVLYDCESDYISLYKEIDYISSFLEFQQLKTENRQNIEFNIGLFDENYQIAPMFLVGFVENAFKHSKIEKDKSGFVSIYLWQSSEKFYFSVENSMPEVVAISSQIKLGGIGIENAKSRLALMYPNKHKLQITKTDNRHKVVLELYK